MSIHRTQMELQKKFRYRIRDICYIFLVFGLLLTTFVWLKTSSRPYQLIRSSYEGDTETVEHLLSLGTKTDHRDRWDGTALMYASSGGHLGIVKRLISAGANINERSRLNRTPLMWAAEGGHLEVARFLKDAGADVTLEDEKGETAQDIATRKGFNSITLLLDNRRG